MKHVLVVDDSNFLAELLSDMLKFGGFDVKIALSGIECIKYLDMRIPDLILLDIMMEPIDGWETLAIIRNNIKTSRIPVVILSGKQPTLDDINFHMFEIEDYLMKPVTIKKLLTAINDTFARADENNNNLTIAKEKGLPPDLADEYEKLLKVNYTLGKFLKLLQKIYPDDTISYEKLNHFKRRLSEIEVIIQSL